MMNIAEFNSTEEYLWWADTEGYREWGSDGITIVNDVDCLKMDALSTNRKRLSPFLKAVAKEIEKTKHAYWLRFPMRVIAEHATGNPGFPKYSGQGYVDPKTGCRFTYGVENMDGYMYLFVNITKETEEQETSDNLPDGWHSETGAFPFWK